MSVYITESPDILENSGRGRAKSVAHGIEDSITYPKEKGHERRDYHDIIVVIDPGHGGTDPGKIGGNGILEKDINLSISHTIKKLLEKEKIFTIMTREDDKGLYSDEDNNKKRSDLEKRCQLINSGNTNKICVSIHQNSYPNESISGPQVFYYSKSLEGKKLAQTLQDEINTKMMLHKPRSQKENNNYYLLVKTKCPTVIVECGFLSNKAELALLVSESYQKKMAEAIVSGIIRYMDD
jgi:N-acetylmuramoyl-L-alanine amidase